MNARRPRALVALLVVAACGPSASTPKVVHETPISGGAVLAPSAGTAEAPDASAPKEKAAPSPLVVTLVVDQLAAWIVAERIDTLPSTGGFARLRREGLYVRRMRYAHSTTDTAPGHASLYTGATPRVSGIFANEVIDADTSATYAVVRDGKTKLVCSEGSTEATGCSADSLKAPTVADAFKKEHPEGIVASISIKDRGAIFAGGRTPTASLWFDPKLDAFVTATPFASAFPAWASPHATTGVLQHLRAMPWNPLDAPWVKTHAGTADDGKGEGDWEGFGTTFPHRIDAAKKPAVVFRASPFADEAVLRLGTAALDALPAGKTPMLLALSLSANDYIGHVFGPDSWEAWDELRRLDAALARFFTDLDDRFGPTGWSAVLAADHGTVSMPEVTPSPSIKEACAKGLKDPWERPCTPGGRIDPEALGRDLQKVAESKLGKGTWVRGVADPFVYLTGEAMALPGPRMKELLGALVADLRKRPGVALVKESASLVSCPPIADESLDALVCRSAPARRDAALVVIPRPGFFFDPMYTPGHGTSHGTPYLYDRTVPLFVRAPGRITGGKVMEGPIPFGAFARSATRLLGVAPPSLAEDAPALVP